MKLCNLGLLRLQHWNSILHITDPQCVDLHTTIIILLTKLKQYHAIFTLLIGPISKRYITLSVRFNVEITLQSRGKRSASGGFAPRPPPGALPLDPTAAFPFQVSVVS